MVKIFISTGEVSGDLQGGMLINSLQTIAKEKGIELEILALGGEAMAKAGAKLLGNTTSIGSVGLLESLPYVLPTWQIQRQAKQYLLANPPDILILIDYPGPNLAIGSYVRKHLPEIPIIYYIAPQDWVWSPLPQNTRKMVEITDLLLAIFPEEAKYFQKQGLAVKWVGHPLLDRMKSSLKRQESRENLGIKEEQLLITFLPASRKQEIKYLLPIMCEAASKIKKKLPDVKFLIPLSLSLYRQNIEAAINNYNLSAEIVEGKTLEAIAASDLAITKSGTVNLEIALLKIPQVVIYRVNPITMWIARKILKFSIPFMSPPNLILMREIVPELLQEKATSDRIFDEAMNLLLNQKRREEVILDYQEMEENLGKVGVCHRAALEIIEFIYTDKNTSRNKDN